MYIKVLYEKPSQQPAKTNNNSMDTIEIFKKAKSNKKMIARVQRARWKRQYTRYFLISKNILYWILQFQSKYYALRELFGTELTARTFRGRTQSYSNISLYIEKQMICWWRNDLLAANYTYYDNPANVVPKKCREQLPMEEFRVYSEITARTQQYHWNEWRGINFCTFYFASERDKMTPRHIIQRYKRVLRRRAPFGTRRLRECWTRTFRGFGKGRLHHCGWAGREGGRRRSGFCSDWRECRRRESSAPCPCRVSAPSPTTGTCRTRRNP